jgi:hypothetical protein
MLYQGWEDLKLYILKSFLYILHGISSGIIKITNVIGFNRAFSVLKAFWDEK